MPSVISGDANVSAAEFGYLDGVTSALQTQIDSKPTGTTGAWISYTPTLTNWSVGAGTATGSYARIGNTVHVIARFVLGASFTTSLAPIRCSLPVAASLSSQNSNPFNVYFLDAGNNIYVGVGTMAGSTLVDGYSLGSSTGAFATPSSTVPFTWAVNDEIRFSGTYEAA